MTDITGVVGELAGSLCPQHAGCAAHVVCLKAGTWSWAPTKFQQKYKSPIFSSCQFYGNFCKAQRQRVSEGSGPLSQLAGGGGRIQTWRGHSCCFSSFIRVEVSPPPSQRLNKSPASLWEAAGAEPAPGHPHSSRCRSSWTSPPHPLSFC